MNGSGSAFSVEMASSALVSPLRTSSRAPARPDDSVSPSFAFGTSSLTVDERKLCLEWFVVHDCEAIRDDDGTMNASQDVNARAVVKAYNENLILF